MRIDNEIKLDYKDVLIRPKRSTLGSRKEVKLTRTYKFRNSNATYNGIPIMAANMDGVGTFNMAETLSSLQLFTCLQKGYSADELIHWINTSGIDPNSWSYSMGINESDIDKFKSVLSATGDKIKFICVDVANGYSEKFLTSVKTIRNLAPNSVIIAGNVVTGEMTEELILSGVDLVKVGIGPGSVCTTRIKTGVGYPQLSAVIECSDAAHGLGGHIIADGGCSSPGDVAKAFAAGADFVMLGGMLAGHIQGGGDIIDKMFLTDELITGEDYSGSLTFYDTSISTNRKIEIRQYVQFYGMSSKTANDKHFGGLKEYRSSEGRTVLVPYRGNVEDTIQEILGGLRSAMTYCGANQLKNLSKCATLIRCTQTHNQIFEKLTTGN